MAIIRVKDFGGEIPRVPARELPPGAAVTNQNLLATAVEFRPVLAPVQRAVAQANGVATPTAKTLWRRLRGSNGAVRTDETTGWFASPNDLNIVKGQLVDDATERAYLTFNDGSAPPRASDMSAETAPYTDRLLGVPAPTQPTAAVQASMTFTMAEARAWSTATLIPAMAAAFNTYLVETLPEARFYTGLPTAGITSLPSPWTLPTYVGPGFLSQRGIVEPWHLIIGVNSTLAGQVRLNDGQLGGIDGGDGWVRLAISVLPFWGTVRNPAGFTAAIGAIANPRDPTGTTKLWTGATLTAVANQLIEYFSAVDKEMMAKRATLDAAFNDFVNNAYQSLISLDDLPAAPGAEPLLTDAAYEGWINQPARYVEAETGSYEQAGYTNAEYDDWKADHDAWEALNTPYLEYLATADRENIARVAGMVAAQRKCEQISHEIEAMYVARKVGLTDRLTEFVNGRGLEYTTATPTGLLVIDPDRIFDSRYYVMTWVTDWKEESAHSPISALVEPDQNDSVLITRPAVPSGRNITHWRLYRSNTGTDITLFQLMLELPAGTPNYLDSLDSDQLLVTAPPNGWLEPPVRATTSGITNTNPYLRGLTGGPNGVMGGFIDNFVAFCDPYHPYAWPVRYQIPVEFPIVGLGVSGQTWFVGTQGNPYLITGTDPGSYSAQKLDEAQACVSAKGIVAGRNGVFFPSPDGYCLASSAGVEVVTQGLFSREDWQALVPSSIFAIIHDNVLYFWHTGNGGGCFGFDMVARKLTRHSIAATTVFSDVVTDGVFAANGGFVYKLFGGSRAAGVWKSGTTVSGKPENFSWLKITGDQTADVPVTFKWWGDGVLRHTATVTSNASVKLPPGEYLEHIQEITSAARITELVMTSSMEEMKKV